MLTLFNTIRKNLPLQLLIVIGLALLLGPYISTATKSALFATSESIKEVLIFFLPFIIFSLLFSCILTFHNGALKFIILLLVCVCASNFISSMIAYGLSQLSIVQITEIAQDSSNTQVLQAAWSFVLPRWIPNQNALFLGFVLGTVFSFKTPKIISSLANGCKQASMLFLNKLFIPIVPLFVLGYIVKLDYENILTGIIQSYGPIFVLILVAEVAYLSLLYAVASNFNPKTWIQSIKNVLPSTISGFSTMSSAASMPLTLKGAEANTGNPQLSRAVIPATVNIHLVGDGIAVPIMAIATMLSFGVPAPDLQTYLVFALYFVLTKFAIAGVPGGGVLVMIPVFQNYLGFTPEMSTLITAVYIMLDPLLTASNVTGNGAFAMIFSKIFKNKRKP